VSGPLREDLAASGATLVEEGQGGFRVTPPSVASLGRAVAVVRAWKLPLRVRGSGDAPVHAPQGGVLLDMGSIDRIASVDGATGMARVEAGCSVAALEAAARRAGCTLGPLLPSVRAGSVGAWLAGPTRGERGVPGARRETAALSVEAVLADGRLAESRAAPRSATGPDLDHLALGGGGRLCVVAAAWIRLFPVAPALASAWRCRDQETALAGLEALCKARLAPARARVHAGAEEGARLGLAWEGLATASMERDRAGRLLEGLGCAPEPDFAANPWVRSPLGGHPVEVDARWPALRGWTQHGELTLLGFHAGGAFAALALPEAGGAEECASLARGAGARVLAPRRLRDAGPAWEALGAGAAWQRLIEALGVEEAPG
jgi:FAD/FMN-containing dehydrogenase